MTSFHFIGIGGAGMSVVAELLHSKGHVVSGSDKAASPTVDRLSLLGITTFVGHDSCHVPSEATVVVSTAVRESNPELAIARERGQEVIHRSVALALAAEGMKFVAVAGAHGKTTTSGMLVVALDQMGTSPSAAVGSVIPQFGSGARLGTGDIFVAEADESDGSFLNYNPTVALVTNIEPDHLDRYESTEAFEAIFVEFAHRIVPGGFLICCAEDAGAAGLAEAMRPTVQVVTYGRPSRSLTSVDVAMGEIESTEKGVSTSVQWGDIEASISLNVPGVHNALNAVGAWASAVALGVDASGVAAALSSFTGTARRFEKRGQVGSRTVVDDYAHHPTEVAAAIAQARNVAQGKDVVVVFQPHLFSRTVAFAERFASALSAADYVVVADIYAAREDPQPGIDSSIITSKIPHARWIPDMFEATRDAAAHTGEGGYLITMGAGDITLCADEAVKLWESQS